MGGKTTTSTNKVTIPKEVLDRYNAVNAQAAKVAENPFQKYGTTQEDFVAQFNEQQLKGVQGINDVAGMGAVYENVDKYLNPYTKNVADTTRAQMEQANEQAQSGALGTAVQSGAFGGDRAGVAAANLSNQQNLAMGSTMANIYNQGYTQAIDTSMNDRNRMLGVAGAQLGAGTQMQQTEQAGLDALINQFQQEQGYPFQVAQFLANIAMGTGALSGSTTTGTQMAPFFSDRRLKHDIKKIGEADNGLPIYTFKYKGDENQQTHVGFMADEVEKKNPDAVGLDPSGYKTVDYDKAAESMGGAVKAFADGGVAGPYGSKVGQGVGVGGYVPQAYLPVGELMVADPSFAQQSQANFLDTLNSAATAGSSVLEFRDKLRELNAEKEARGGVVGGYAEGGGVKPQVHGDYMSTTLAAQAADKDKPKLDAIGQQGQQESGFSKLANTVGNVATIANALPMIFSSDRRLKHDIKRIGKTEKGLPIYTFKYKGDNREQTHIGFMADEVERKNPDAVGERNGYKTVDYSQAHKFATGGVAGRHGYALDGAVEDRIRDAMRKAAAAENDMRLTRDEIPAVQTLGSLPDAKVVAAEAPSGYVGPNSRGEGYVGPNSRGEAASYYLGLNKPTRQQMDDLFVSRGMTKPIENLLPPRPTAVATEAPTGVVPEAENDMTVPEWLSTFRLNERVPAGMASVINTAVAPFAGAAGLGLGLVGASDAGNAAMDFARQRLVDANDFADVSLGTDEQAQEIYRRRAAENLVAENDAANQAIAAAPLTVDQRPKPRPVQGGVAAGAPSVEDESARFYRMAAANRFNAENAAPTGVVPVSAPVDGQVRPKPRPLGLAGADVAADTVAAGVPVGAYEEMASTMREAGIANLAGDKLVPTGVAPADGQMRPKPRPEGLGAANISAPVIVGTTMTPAEGGSEFNLDRLAAAIRFQESGSPSGNYGAIGQPVSRANGTEDRAYGAYQIMGANIPSWTKEVLGRSMTPEEFLADPQAQETVAMAKLGEYYRKFGSAEDVASVWFSGRPLEGNNSYDATSKKSVPLYVSEVMAKYYGGGEGTPANYDIGTSPSGVTGISGGLRADTAGATSGGVKPYEDRNTLGKMMYDEDGRINKNALLSLIAGFGDMLTSPSPFLLPSIGAGVAGAARTYMAREEQVADIAQKQAETNRTNIIANSERYFRIGADGLEMVTLLNGDTVTLGEYLGNENLRASENPQTEAIIRDIAAEKAANAEGTIFSTPLVKGYIEKETANYSMNPAAAKARTDEIMTVARTGSENARASLPALMLQTNAISGLDSSGVFQKYRTAAIRVANDILRMAGQEELSSSATDAEIATKAAIIRSLEMAGGSNQNSAQALDLVLQSNANASYEPLTNAKIMASTLLANQRAIDLNSYLSEYQDADGNDFRTVNSGGVSSFGEAYQRQYMAEEKALEKIVYGGSNPIGDGGYTILQLLSGTELNSQQKNNIAVQYLRNNGMSEAEIENLGDISRYFGG